MAPDSLLQMKLRGTYIERIATSLLYTHSFSKY